MSEKVELNGFKLATLAVKLQSFVFPSSYNLKYLNLKLSVLNILHVGRLCKNDC